MITFNLKLANKVIEVNAFNETTLKYCKDFLTTEKSNYSINMRQGLRALSGTFHAVFRR